MDNIEVKNEKQKQFKSVVDVHMNMWAEKLKKVKLPKIGKKVIFYDDGKFSRPYEGVVCAVIPKKDGEYQIVTQYNEDHGREISVNLLDVLNDNTKMYDWIFTGDTDYFIGAAIPDYDEHILWFARDKYNGWFSMDIQHDWQGGRLDVDGSITKEIEKERKEYENR